MKNLKYVTGLILGFSLAFAVTAIANRPGRFPPVRMIETGFPSSGGASSSPYTGTCGTDTVVFDNNAFQGCAQGSDVAPATVYASGQAIVPNATVNLSGGDLYVCGGLGSTTVTVTAANFDPADTISLVVDGATAYTLTDGTEFTSVGTDAALATAIAALWTARTGISAQTSTNIIYIGKAATEPGACSVAVTVSDATSATIVDATDGKVVLYNKVFFGGTSATHPYLTNDNGTIRTGYGSGYSNLMTSSCGAQDAGSFYFSTRGELSSTGDGAFRMRNNALTTGADLLLRGTMNNAAYTGQCSAAETVVDINGMQKCPVITDEVPAALLIKGSDALSSATVNTQGGPLHLCGGSGVDRATVTAAASDPGETFTILVNGSTTTYTDNTHFTSVGTDAQLATDIAALITTLTGIEASANSPTSGTIYVKPDINEPGVCYLVLGGTNGATVTSGFDGNIILYPNAPVNNSFGNLTWVAATSIHPALRKDSASLTMQLADMSAGTYLSVGGSNQGIYFITTGSSSHYPNNGGLKWSTTTSGGANGGGPWFYRITDTVLGAGAGAASGSSSINHGQTITAKTGAYTVTDADSGTIFTNEGTSARVDFTLPTAAANRCYTWAVQDADGIKVIAAAGDTIRYGVSVSGAAGYICDAATIGNTITLCAINAIEWWQIGTPFGTWTVDLGC